MMVRNVGLRVAQELVINVVYNCTQNSSHPPLPPRTHRHTAVPCDTRVCSCYSPLPSNSTPRVRVRVIVRFRVGVGVEVEVGFGVGFGVGVKVAIQDA